MRSPLRSPPRSLPRSPMRSPPRSLPRSPPRSLPRSPLRSPHRSPHRVPLRSPPPRSISPHRYAGVYDELLSPPRRNVEPPYGPRFGRNNGPPPNYPPLGTKPIPPLMGNLALPVEPPPGYRSRYDGPPPFEDIPPGVEPPVPGFEPPPFEKPPFGPPGAMDRDRLPPSNYRDTYGPRPSYVEGPNNYRDMPLSSAPNEIPVHVGEPPRFRENYRSGGLPYRDAPPPQFRDGQPFREVGPQGPYRDPNYRGAPPTFRDGPYRNAPFREPGFRENVQHNAFREGGPPFRPPSVDPRETREPVPTNYHDPNFRDAFRDEAVLREHGRPGYRPGARSRGGPRRNPNIEHDRHREREGHERERYNEPRETDRVDRSRDAEKRGRDGRARDYDRGREYEKERDHDRITPDKKIRGSPKRSKDGRDKRRSESRGRSRERDSKKEKKDERNRDKSSAERSKDHKDKDKKLKDRKKKKREKDNDKKKKRDKKEKKEKESTKKEGEGESEVPGQENTQNVKDQEPLPKENQNNPPVIEQKGMIDTATPIIKQEKCLKVVTEIKPLADLYGDEASEAVDKEIIQNYVKTEENEPSVDKSANKSNDEPFDGIELQANAEELDLKPEPEAISKEMLAPLPELSKWEVDDDNPEKSKEPGEITSAEEEEDGGKVTSDVIKRAEHAIFTKAIGSLRPIEIKKISNDRVKLYSDESTKSSMNNIQITVPVTDSDQRSIEVNERKKRFSKTPPPRLSVKERLGGKVEDFKRGRESRVVQSTVERVKSRSKTPKKEQPYRRVTVEKERGRKQEPIGRQESTKAHEKHPGRSPRDRKDFDKRQKEDRKVNESVNSQSHDKTSNKSADHERKKSTLDEAHFEPDYDENVESDTEMKEDNTSKKRERSASPTGNETKKAKIDNETIKLDLANVKKKPDTESESSSVSEDSSSSSSDDARKRKKKKKRSKKKRKRAASESDSDSDSSSDDHKKKKKKRKHKKKSSKKKKKSKHK